MSIENPSNQHLQSQTDSLRQAENNGSFTNEDSEQMEVVDLEQDPNRNERIEKRSHELEGYRDGLAEKEASTEIEKVIKIPVTDAALIDKEVELLAKTDSKFHLQKEDAEKLRELNKKRITDFIKLNADLFTGVPKEILDAISDNDNLLREVGYLLSLPYHLEKMKKDGITHVILSASSSIPYGILFKELEELGHSDEDKIQFLIHSFSTTEEGHKQQDKKFIDYFSKYPEAKIGVFDECASSDEHSKFNKRMTVTRLKEEIEKLLSVSVVGRYGVDTVFPEISPGKQITLGTSSYGDEGKGGGLGWMSNLIETDKLDVEGKERINIIAKDKQSSLGYKFVSSGASGLRKFEKIRHLAKIASENFLNNPHSAWDPFNETIRLGIDPCGYDKDGSDEWE